MVFPTFARYLLVSASHKVEPLAAQLKIGTGMAVELLYLPFRENHRGHSWPISGVRYSPDDAKLPGERGGGRLVRGGSRYLLTASARPSGASDS